MGKPTGFMEYERLERSYAPAADRVQHYNEFVIALDDGELRQQGARCMDCGIPFCHQGCPVNNIIPDWNDLVYQGNWQDALQVLHSTNNFPEFTGRICPAPCEAACTLNLDDNPVTIKTIECSIVDKGWEQGWIKPHIAEHKTGKRVAIVGSGPAGMACAQQLARAGHDVDLFEKNDRVGGLLRYGIPDFKMEKHIIDRRMAQMQAEGVTFHTGTDIGGNKPAKELLDEFDAVVLTGGSEHSRDLEVPGRDLDGVHFAMTFLPQQNKRNAGDTVDPSLAISAKGKTSLSSVAAIPVQTASAPPSARVRCPSPSWKSCRNRRKRKTRPSPGQTGRTRCAPPAHRMRAQCVTGLSPPGLSRARTARSPRSIVYASTGNRTSPVSGRWKRLPAANSS